MKWIFSLFFMLHCGILFPIIGQTSVLNNQALGKRVTLLGDMHDSYIRSGTQDSDDSSELHARLFKEHKEKLTLLTSALANLDERRASQIVIITEIDGNSFGRCIEQELDLVPREENNTLHILSRACMKNIINTLDENATADEKAALFLKQMKPFNDVQTASFTLSNGMRWIAGDRERNDKDRHLAFTIYKHYQEIHEAHTASQTLPEELENLTIASVIAYITDLHQACMEWGIKDPCSAPLLDTINAAIAAGDITPENHFATLHHTLMLNKKSEQRDTLNNNILSLISFKFDIEILNYLNAFEKDENLKHAILCAGGAHTDILKKLLLERGYSFDAEAGTDFSELETTLFQNFKEVLSKVDQNPPYLDIHTLLS